MSVIVRPAGSARGSEPGAPGPGYKWVALSSTTLGALLASVNASIMLIALPEVCRGIGVNPLQPGNGSLLLGLIMGDRARGARDRCGAGGIPAAGLGAVRLAARLQPGAYPARPAARPPAPRPGRVPDQPRLLPHPDQPRLRPGPVGGVRLRGLRLADRRSGLATARREVRLRRIGRSCRPARRGHRGRRGLACLPALGIAGFTRIVR